MRRLLHIVALALAFPSVALAQDSPPDLTPEQIERARNHFNAGLAYYEDGRWENAAREFEESYRITRHPDVLYNVAQSYDRLDRHEDAITAYRGYLEQQPTASDRETVERRIRELEARMTAEESAPEAPPREEPTLPEEPETTSVLPYVVLGVAGALAIGAAITGGMALSVHSDLEETCGGPCPPDRNDDIDRGESLALWSTILTVGALVGVGAGITLLVLDSGGAEETARLELTPGPAPAGAGARLRF